ncbi:hypothetical protein [Jiella sp. M17.18]|uniref:hypothetical protein n=1 Tax=Jiella sp. M17.18 TaxID=3234247 RepID=UPI0034DDE446
MSVVFLADDRVYKLKKPVSFPFLDFSTLAARERNCLEEVRLNRRLAPQVYRGAMPLSVTAEGALVLGRGVTVVDWLVAMRRLPDWLMLDRLLARGHVSPHQLDRLGAVLARFYHRTGHPRLTAHDHLARIVRQQAENRAVLTAGRWRIDHGRIASILDRFERRLDAVRPLLERRVSSGCIVEGHGDLRPEHICMSEPIAIFDCLEFDRDLRLLDPFEEIAYLGLECTLLGHAEVGAHLGAYLARSLSDPPPRELTRFYTAFRALLRARLALAHLLDPVPRDPERWEPLAESYLALAAAAVG